MRQSFGERITELREAKGLTKSDVCRKTYMSQTGLLKLERGEINKPAFHIIVRLSEVFNVPVESWVPYIMPNLDKDK